jgi:hypothetical protein
MGGKITKATVDALEKGSSLADTEVKGFVARRLPSGVVTYGFRYRNAAGRQADRVLARLRTALAWHATRDDTFTPPLVRGMTRTDSGDRARLRSLTDEEIRALWRTADRLGTDSQADRTHPRRVVDQARAAPAGGRSLSRPGEPLR